MPMGIECKIWWTNLSNSLNRSCMLWWCNVLYVYWVCRKWGKLCILFDNYSLGMGRSKLIYWEICDGSVSFESNLNPE